ncbi:MAG: pyrroline-5-carboxylate reductase [Clostridia bacterium]|nr:pyrroline-5-carboxylate reductase [Clostridia bacterium]
MREYKFGFIGTGNMGSALASAVANAIGGNEVALTDKSPEKAEILSKKIGANVVDISELVLCSKYIFLGVKPQMLNDLFSQINIHLKGRKDRFVLISMAAGVSIDDIKKKSSAYFPVIRIMPNTPVETGNGMILYRCDNLVSDTEKEDFKDALSKAGKLDEIDEKLIDAASAVSGCGPAFVYMFAEALADGAVECGLPRDKALNYAAQTILGAGDMILKSGKHPELLKDNVCSPAGSTIAGVHALENSNFRAACIDAVNASFKRTKELGK